MTVEKGVSFWVQSTIIPPPWPPPFNDLLRTGQKGARARVSVGACVYVPMCVCGCTRVYAHTYMCIHAHIRVYMHIHKRRRPLSSGYHLLPNPSETFLKTLTKTLDKMTDLWYAINVIREGENLGDHSCTSCVLEDGDPSWLGFPFSFFQKVRHKHLTFRTIRDIIQT